MGSLPHIDDKLFSFLPHQTGLQKFMKAVKIIKKVA